MSNNDGTSWAADSSSLKNVNCFLVASNQLFAGTDDSGVYLSLDSGATWAWFGSGMSASARVWSLAATSDNIFAGTDSGIWRAANAVNSAPTVATAASASPNPVTGTTTSLSVLGADDGGEANLTYTWATLGTPPAPVIFKCITIKQSGFDKWAQYAAAYRSMIGTAPLSSDHYQNWASAANLDVPSAIALANTCRLQ